MAIVACPTGCASVLPVVKFDKCSPEFRLSEITHLLIAKANAAPFTAWLSAAEWGTRVSMTTTTDDAIRPLTVRANKPAPTGTDTTLTRNRVFTTSRRHVINFVIDEMTDENYDMARMLECGNIQVRFWFITNDTKEIVGGAAGILATIRGSVVYDEGEGAIQRIEGTVEWTALQSPERGLNPIAGL